MIVRELVARLGFDGAAATRQAERFEAVIGKLKWGLAALAAATAAAGVGLVKMTTEVANQGDAIAKTAQDLGIAAAAYQELKYSADLAGVSQEEMNTSLKMFTRNVGEARAGAKSQIEAFAKLGVTQADLASMPLDKILDKAANGFARTENAADRAALSMELFGRSGQRMGTWLSQGTEALKKQRARAQQLGAVMSDKLLAYSERYNDSAMEMGLVIESLKFKIAEGLLPVIVETYEAIANWWAENGKLIRQRVEVWARRIGTAMKWTGNAIVSAARAVNGLVKSMGGWDRTGRLLLSFLGATALLRAPAIIGAITVAIRGAALASLALARAWLLNPWTWVVAAIALVLEDIWVWIKDGESATGLWLGKWEDFRKKVTAIPAAIKQAWADVTAWWNKLLADLSQTWRDFVAKIRLPTRKELIGGLQKSLVAPIKVAAAVGKATVDAIPPGVREAVHSFGNINPATMFGPGPALALAAPGPAGRPAIHQNFNERVTINVPAGTTQEQAASMEQQFRRIARSEQERALRYALGDVPAY